MCPGSGSFISATKMSLGTSLSARSSTPTSNTAHPPTPAAPAANNDVQIPAQKKPHEARARLGQDTAPPRVERNAPQPRARALDEGDDLRRVHRRARAPDFQRPTTGADAQISSSPSSSSRPRWRSSGSISQRLFSGTRASFSSSASSISSSRRRRSCSSSATAGFLLCSNPRRPG